MRVKTFRQTQKTAPLTRKTSGKTHSAPDRQKREAVATATSGSGKRVIFPWLTRLQHGVIRYKSVSASPTSVANFAANANTGDRRFVYFPAGYFSQNDKCLEETLHALGLFKLPNLLIVTAATDGAVEEHMGDDDTNESGNLLQQGRNNNNRVDDDGDFLTPEEELELLREKTQELLKSMVEQCGEMNAWLLPHRPRRINGAAEILCSAVRKKADGSTKAPVILGLIGLDQDDHGLAAKITQGMVPVGTKIQQVIELSYDPENPTKDAVTPCPELTHLLFFQRRREMREFRERLLQLVPDLFLAFGPTTSYAKECMFANIVHQSPVALITHTAQATDDMATMLRHVDREFAKYNVGAMDMPPPIGMETHQVLGKTETFATQPVPPLSSLPEGLCEYLNKWPASHDAERVVLADPRRVGGVRFQHELLRAVTAAFYIRVARRDAVKAAHQILTKVQAAAHGQQRRTEMCHLGMVCATFAAVTAAVLYAKIFADAPPPSLENRNPFQIATFLLTLVLPMVSLVAKKKYDFHSHVWSTLQDEVAALESVIVQFRTRMASYGHPDRPMEPLDAFVHDVETIHIRSNALTKPVRNADDAVAMAGAGEELMGGASALALPAFQDKVMVPLPSAIAQLRTRIASIVPASVMERLNAAGTSTDAAVGEAFAGIMAAPDEQTKNLTGVEASTPSAAQEGVDIEAPPATESTPLLSKSTAPPPVEDIAAESLKWAKYTVDDDEINPNETGDATDDSYIDLDGHRYGREVHRRVLGGEPSSRAATDGDRYCSSLMIKEYIECRMGKEKDRKLTEIQTWESRNRMIDNVIKGVALLTTLLAMLSKQWFIPIAVGASAIFASSQDFRKYTKRIEQANGMVRQLDDLLSWWSMLDVEQKILQCNQDRLVHDAETIILADKSFTY